jgi:AraC-like DNA-binding protein
MKNCFNIQKRHKIAEAGIHYFPDRVTHPNRIMYEHDFIYMLEGSWTLGQNGIDYKLLPDDILILHAGEHHYNVENTLPNTKTVYIHANTAEGDRFIQDDVDENLDSSVYLDIKLSCLGYSKPKNLFFEIVSEFWSDNSQKDIKLSALFDILLFELSKIKGNKKEKVTNEFMEQILCVIYMNPQKFYKLNELANMLHISTKTLTDMFKKHTNVSVHEYQIKKKIDMAKTKIKLQPNTKLKEIAEEYGFYDEFHLSKVFKKYTGISPKEYKTSNI